MKIYIFNKLIYEIHLKTYNNLETNLEVNTFNTITVSPK